MAFKAQTNPGMPARLDRQVESRESVRVMEGFAARI